MEELQPHAMPSKPLLFSNKALLSLIIPLVIERFLEMTVGVADTIMVTSIGEAPVSGIALVDNINNLVIFILSALATGGAVVISQYLGRGDARQARTAAKQLFYATLAASLLVMAAVLFTRVELLRLLFGNLEQDVMEYAKNYLLITAISYPFIAIFNSIAAVFRSMGIGKISMFTSLLMNIVNIGGNAWLIYGLNWDVVGAATASLASRIVASAAMLFFIHNRRNPVFLSKLFHVRLKWDMIKSILKIGVPSGIENGMFHMGRLITQGLVTTFGTAAIAANAVASSTVNMMHIPGVAIGLSIITVCGQCFGAGDYPQSIYYLKRLMKYIYIFEGTVCVLMFFLSAPLARMFNLSPDATAMCELLLKYAAVFVGLFHPVAFPFSHVLRAAGDIKFTMIVSFASMWIIRVGLGYALASFTTLALLGIWLAMYADWVVRAAAFLLRFFGGKWREKRVIT